jgi:hypothetical protein
MSFGLNFPHFWNGPGSELYDETNPLHRCVNYSSLDLGLLRCTSQLVMWLWPPVIQQELDKFRFQANNRRVRKQKQKSLPSGVSPNIAYTFPEKFGGTDQLQPVDIEVIQEILDQMQAEKDALADWGIPEDFAQRAQAAFVETRIVEVSVSNIWIVFQCILLRL